jgi:hypothetical protein
MDEHHEDDTAPARQRVFKKFDDLIDQLIGKARKQGQFDNLSGTGQALNTTDDELVPPEDRLAFRVLKNNGFAPPWMEARRDIEQERAKLEEWLQRTNRSWATMQPTSRTAAKVEYKRKLEDLRRMIMNYNLTTPVAAGQIEGLDLEHELARLGR